MCTCLNLKQTNSSLSNSSLRSHSNLTNAIASHVSHHFLNPNCTFPYKVWFCSLVCYQQVFSLFFYICDQLYCAVSAHSEAFIFYSIVTIVAIVESSIHFLVSYILLHTSTRHFFPLKPKALITLLIFHDILLPFFFKFIFSSQYFINQ